MIICASCLNSQRHVLVLHVKLRGQCLFIIGLLICGDPNCAIRILHKLFSHQNVRNDLSVRLGPNS